MLSIIAKRLAVAVPTLIIVTMIVFALQQLLPGDPLLTLAGEERDPEVLAYLRELYRLDDPIYLRYVTWLGEVMTGDFGISLRTEIPVATLILERIPITLQLATMAMFWALLIGIPVGIVAAVHKGTWIDYVANVFALSGLSIPNFWLGILMIFLVSVKLQWLPASGYVSPTEDLYQSLRTMLMPSIVLGTALAGQLMRHTRSAMLGVLRSDYIRTARAKGLLQATVVYKHALRNALVPIVTLLTLVFGELMAGAVLTEQIFTIPGFGKLIVDAVFTRDYAVVQGIVLVTAIGFIMMNLVADVLYVLINPRLRHA